MVGTASVSVIVPCYCNGDVVARAVRSALTQTVPPFEVVAVDDASTDDTRQRLRALQDEFGRERLLVIESAENRGPASARNAGWEAARGEFVAFLDADDAWHPRKLEIQVEFMRTHPQFSMSGHQISFEDAPRDVLPHGRSVPFREIGLGSLLYRNWFHTSSVMMRRDLTQRFVAGQRYGEDRQLWLDLAAAGTRIARLNLPLVRVYKPMYGANGLSAQLWAMESAELQNFFVLHRTGRIGAPLLCVLLAWSLMRFLRRLALVALRRMGWTIRHGV
jgi:glycosyltransferase involved in cell wall biosynthesis